MAVTTIQTGDGSQEASASTFRPGGFGPSPTPDLRTNVAAPLDVRGAPSQASYLAAQLQQSLDTMRWPLMSAERIQGMQREQQAEAQGRGDAAAGNVNPELVQKDSAYQRGAMTTLGQKYGYQLAQWAQQQITDPNSGWSGMTQQQLMAALDAQSRKTMGGMETDPYFASAAAPIVQHIHNEVLGWKVKAQHDSDVEQMRSNTGAALTMAAQGGPAFNYAQAFATYRNTFGGDGNLARTTLDQDILSYAQANRNLQALDYIQPAPGQTALPPKTQLMVSEARTAITRANTEAQAQYTQSQSFGVLSAWDKQLTGRTPIPFSEINQAVQQHRITQQQGLEYYDKSLKLGEQLDRQTGASTILASGQPWWDAVGTPKEAGKAPYTKQDFVAANDAAIDKLPEEQRDAAAVMRTRQYGLIYTPLATRVNNEPVTTAQGVKDVLSTYNAMNSTDASITGQYFSDPRRLAEVHQMLTLRQAGMGDDDIATYMQKHTGAQSAQDVGAKASDINKALATTTFQSGHFWNGGKVDMATIANPGQVQQRALALAHQMAASGACTGATCAAAAAKAVIDQSYVIKLSDNHSLVIPRAVTDPPVSQSQSALQFWYNKALPDIAKATGHDAADLRLVPNSSQPGSYTLTDSTGLPVTEQAFTLPAIVSYWQKAQGDAVRAKQQTAAATAVRSAQGQAAALNSEVNLIGR